MRRAPIPPEERCRRTRCIRKAVKDGICLAHLKKQGKSRYGVKRVKDSTGREYQSKAEREGMAEFRLRELAGEIEIVGEQVTVAHYIGPDHVSFLLCSRLGVNEGRPGTRIEAARWDVMWRTKEGRLHVGDFKRGLFTDDFRRKARWMAACGWPVEIILPRMNGRGK